MLKPLLSSCALLLALSAPMVQAAEAPYVYSGTAAMPSQEQDQQVASLFERWNAALQSGDSAKVTALYAENAVLQPTVSNRVRVNHAEIQDYFDHFLQAKPVGTINMREIRQVGPDAAIDSGVYTFALTQDGKVRNVQARYTFVYQKVAGEWKILKHHSSAMPEQLAAK
ncbi:MAG: SgcJ/EcaC family oxidoreductase [Gammaproteobacteria bacterium]|nr:SgcJ/EcaC family oxidoreductase [Gammaproteobacteria bacterium]MBU1488868.1 SgcJ/EcaC family oxidoreductase [Gammaproteobacteria bacterium]MBU2067423.1 SgcJ/EcaC family oxidoreductase [Gammaproteobacteria bacterium]MBU2138858.1 SgcJ/EcaC family oxidoreductase [Gammaproteobacteria bacterium]MBU2216681.1 SgcJ/EcaC family oxidoreductase [Gammaproteobacteria bacterium]